MSWRQVARIMLHTYPHAPNIPTIGKLIWETAAQGGTAAASARAASEGMQGSA